MFKIKMFGEIGWDIMPFMIEENLNEASGQDIEVDLSSVGGQVSKGILISDLFMQYKKNYPNAQMILNIKAEASSMASHFASLHVFDIVTVLKNTLFMIHNPMSFVNGDYREMNKMGDFLKRYAGIMAIDYIQKSKKSVKEVRSIMDDETYYFGQEIIDNGFADEFADDQTVDNNNMIKDKAVMVNKEKMKTLFDKMKNENAELEEFEKAVAMIDKTKETKNTTTNTPAVGGDNNNQEDVLMNMEELKTKHPEIHAEALKAGEDKGKSQVMKNIDALVKMKSEDQYKNIPEVIAVIDESISMCKTAEETQPLIMAAMVGIMNDPKRASRMRADSDSPEDIDGGGSSSISGEDGENKLDDKGEF